MEKRITTLWALTLLACLFGAQAFAQVNVNMGFNTGQQTFTVNPAGSTFNFYDDGGPGLNYSNNCNFNLCQTTFAPSFNPNNKIRANFVSHSTEGSFDALYIYDGANTAAPQFASANGAPLGGGPAGGFWGTALTGTQWQASAVNATGRLTFAFVADGSVTLSGWQATISEVLVQACQLTAPANQTVSVGANCTANVTLPVPASNPSGCANAAGSFLRYNINGGAFTVVNQPYTAPNVSLGKGVYVITWQLVDAGGTVLSSVSFTVTAQDVTAPTITCPANITLNLGPGECSTYYSYNVGLTDNCPFIGPPIQLNTINTGGNFNSVGGAVFFNIVNNTGSDITITQLGMRISAATQVNIYRKAGTHVGFETNAGAWTLTTTANATVGPFSGAGAGNGTLTPANLATPLVLPPGTWGICLHTPTASQQYTNGNGANQTFTSNGVTINLGSAQNALFAGLFSPRVWNGYLVFQTVVDAKPVQTSGIASGGEFPIGTTTNCFIGTDAAGNTATCCFSVTVREFLNPITSLACNDLVQISLNNNCTHTVGADEVLEGGPYRCYANYTVQIDKTLPLGNGPWVPAVLTSADIGKTYAVRVIDPTTGNSCWGTLSIEDKLKPVLSCPEAFIPCNYPTTPCAVNGLVLPADPVQFPASFVNHGGGTAFTLQGNTLSGGVFFNLTNNSGLPATITGFGLRFGNPQFGAVAPPQTMQLFTTPTTYAGKETNAAAWTNVGPAVVTSIPAYFPTGTGPLAQANFTQEVTLQPGETRGFYIFGQTACIVFNYTFAPQAPLTNGIFTQTAGSVSFGQFGPMFSTGALAHPNIQVNYKSVVPTPCLPNGLVLGQNASANGNGSYTVTPGAGTPKLDNCSAVTLTYTDTEVDLGCNGGDYSKRISRKWTATDASGNATTCIQTINVLRPTFSDMVLPPDYDGVDEPAFDCVDGAYPSPDWIEGQGGQGYPYFFGVPEGCTIGYTYNDVVIKVCDGTTKILRKWDVIDWCSGEDAQHNQIIKVADKSGPTISCPSNLTVSTDPFTCCATVNLPDVIITDNCSNINNISWMVIGIDPLTFDTIGMFTGGGSLSSFPGNNLWDLDTLANFGTTPCLPAGTHTVIYMAEDDCGNTSSCTFRLTVRDFTPPVAACDEFTTVAIGIDDPFDCYLPSADGCQFAGVTWVKATTFDDGSYDNCGDVRFTIRRMAPYSDCIQNLNPINGQPTCDPTIDPFPDFPSEFERAISEYDSIKFYCCEVGTTQTVILRVYQLDVNGNITVGPDGTPVFNECMIQVEVQDKIKPVCQSPANVTVSCENFDPSLWAYGKATISDNCCLDTAVSYQGQKGLTHSVNIAQFDTLCNKGTITRTFRAFDCHGFSSQCTQRIVVQYEQDYFVRFPNDVIVTNCNGTGNYGEPTFFGEDCELLGVSFTDELFTVVPDACYKIERTWHIINWCTYNPNLPIVTVPNPNPNAIANNPANLPGPIVSAPGSTTPWTSIPIALAPGQTPHDFTQYYTGNPSAGIPSIANNNGFSYKQIIKVIDNKPPVYADCPASPVTINDLTPNDPLLWNQMYWWDAANGSHDLCETPANLSLTVTDSCSLDLVTVKYLLFLDLDNNGSMETVVSSTNIPAPNTVFFNNGFNPNFSGGEARAFDNRPVAANQKYRFNIDWVKNGNSRTAKVVWDNIQQPANLNDNTITGVEPQLPYGTHKIKWITNDQCGNESVCEYTIIVKDGKAPTVVCLNGLSVNIMPTQMITLFASDFLQYTEDNCSPANLLDIAIVESDESTGSFPVDGQGNPLTSVNFNCSEVGTQLVQLWSRDVAGNADYCETYVLVQDPNNFCGSSPISVAGALQTESQNGLEDANVELNGSHPALPPVSMFDMTDNNGAFNFSNALPMAANYTLTPLKDDNHLNGVTTYDLVLISKHILGLEPLTTPYKMIAADANKSNSITTFDIVELRKLILGIYTELPNNTSWRFVDKSFTFANPTNPFAAQFPEFKSVADVQASQMADNFVSVKVGDVNGSAIANSLMSADDRTTGTLLFDVQDRAVKAGEEFTVNFKAAEVVAGYQFTMNLKGLEVVDIVPGAGMDQSNFGVFADAITTSFDGKDAAEFAVKFRATTTGQISNLLGVSSRITKAEAYKNDARLDVAFRFNGTTIAGVGFELYQNTPNPFISKTQIGFHLPEATEATLTIFDEAGRMIYTQRGDFAKGYNAITLDRNVINATGVLYYKVETGSDSATRKMIQTK